MKKLLMLITLLLTFLTGFTSHCNFSGITFAKIQQSSNTMYFQTNLNVVGDTCWGYNFTVYNYQLDEEDSLISTGGGTGVGVTFGKGKYQMRLNVFNQCLRCDTTFTIEVDITTFNTIGYQQKSHSEKCYRYTFEMEDRNDTCYEYYYQIYRADEYIKGLSDEEWDKIDDSMIYFNYSWSSDLIEYYNVESERVLEYEFKDSGRYLIIPILYNKCTGIDTWSFEKLNVCFEDENVSIEQIFKNNLQDATVIGYYDLLGRRVGYLKPNEIYVVVYSNGKKIKIINNYAQ